MKLTCRWVVPARIASSSWLNRRAVRYDECLAGWQGLASDPTIQFEVEHVDVDDDRAVILWRITGAENYRGVNLMRVRDGKIVEALEYGKRP